MGILKKSKVQLWVLEIVRKDRHVAYQTDQWTTEDHFLVFFVASISLSGTKFDKLSKSNAELIHNVILWGCDNERCTIIINLSLESRVFDV